MSSDPRDSCTVYIGNFHIYLNTVATFRPLVDFLKIFGESEFCVFKFTGNLDERVSDRVLYDILIQAGRVVDLHIPRDKETDKPKGFAFAEYETEEIADYAVRLFTGLVTLYNKTLRFGISGQDKATLNLQAPSMSMLTYTSTFKSSLHEDVGMSPLSRYAQDEDSGLNKDKEVEI
ncbi:unnamed protein product [Lactuca virosa]|uniref:RRM domain-containing protein n=1 Tax=Lactuca virosa TaxID=75947 RepID=A0AAU9NXG9_9ASTR|nr:unnamed protein product [Lactuca virosa]